MRKRSVKSKYYDENILAALKSLPVPLKSFDNHEIMFDSNKRYEPIFNHISKENHRFKIPDILEIRKIVKNKKSLQKDNKKSIFRNYIGNRPKKNARLKYIKIVTKKVSENKETVVTIYLIKNKNIEKHKKNR